MPVPRILSISLTILLSLHLLADARAEDLKDIAKQASQGQQSAALERINSYLAKNPNDVQALFIRGVILAEQGRRDDAIKAFTDITEKHPGLPEPYNNLAVLYGDFMNRPADAMPLYQRFLDQAPKTHPARAEAEKAVAALKNQK